MLGASGHGRRRPPGKTPLPKAVVERVVDVTLGEPPGEATHWTGRAMAKAAGISRRSVHRIWAAHGLQPHRVKRFKLSKDPEFAAKLQDISVCTSSRRPMRSCCPWTKRARFRRSIGPSRACR